MIHRNNFPTVPKNHNLILRIRLAILPVIYRDRRRACGIFPRHMENFTTGGEDIVAFALLPHRAWISFDVWEGRYWPGVEPCSAAARSAGEGVEHRRWGGGTLRVGKVKFGRLALSI